MAYDLGQSLASGDDLLSLTADWVIAVVRFKVQDTFSRALGKSHSLDGSEVAAERGDPLVIRGDVLTVTTSATKESHVKNLVATLLPGGTDYLSEILPGDWVLCWMVQDPDKADDLVRRIGERRACNDFGDGLKFVGRAQAPRERLGVNSDTGVKEHRYTLSAVGFKEFNSQIFWDPYLSLSEPLIDTWLGRMGLAVDSFLSADGIDVNRAIPTLVEIFLGSGVAQSSASPSGEDVLQIVTGGVAGSGEAPFAYVVPETVGRLLGVSSRSKSSGVLACADLWQFLHGVQQYDGGSAGTAWTQFLPSDLKPMMGSFLPAVPQLSGRSLWSVLNQYLNPAANEMYTALRVDYSGRVLPTLVVRQLPFTTDAAAQTSAPRTRFLSLPRWKLPPGMVLFFDRGRSDALRFNLVELTGQALNQAQDKVTTTQRVRSPAIRDDQDIRRSGLAGDIMTVAVGPREQQLGPAEWMALRADFLMGLQLSLNGTVDSVGIQEPICEGDNLEWDGVVYHVEAVAHTCSRSLDGRRRSFMTSLQLSHGLRADPSTSRLTTDGRIYPATSADDAPAGAPGSTRDGGDPEVQTELGAPAGTLGSFVDLGALLPGGA
jgi:hypothetical protein